MELLVCDNHGVPIDATVEIEPNSIVLQSRGGTIGSPHAKNTDYSSGLRYLLKRFQNRSENFREAFVDSSRVQDLPRVDRQILTHLELEISVEKLFTLVSKRMQAVGKSPTTNRHTGNANKRIRFLFSDLSIDELKKLSRGVSKDFATDDDVELSSDEQLWTEGQAKLVLHLKRERAHGLSRAKKAAVLQKHGKLSCEKCGLDPVLHYGDIKAQACIEVHHHSTSLSAMTAGHITRLDDLQCLCANCHRFVHAKLKKQI